MAKKMKKVIILSLIIISLTTGCGICNLSNFILPNNLEFLVLIEELDTPKEICQYMQDNFISEKHPFYGLTPYELYKTKKGDCNDYSTFAIFVANYHGYTTYEIIISFGIIQHAIAVYEENGSYTFSSLGYYFDYETLQNSFRDIVDLYTNYKWLGYKVYDYDMNIVEQVYND